MEGPAGLTRRRGQAASGLHEVSQRGQPGRLQVLAQGQRLQGAGTARTRGALPSYVPLYIDMIEKQLTYDALKIIAFDGALAQAPGRRDAVHAVAGPSRQDHAGPDRRPEGLMQVFYTSPWVPPEWIKAHGLEPRGVWFAGDSRPLPLAAGVCAFAQAVVRLAETHTDSALIFSTHCDQLRRGFDVVALAVPGRVFLFNLPATWQTAVAERIFSLRAGAAGPLSGGDWVASRPQPEGLVETMARYRLARSRLLEAAAHLPARQYGEADRSISLGWLGEPGRGDASAPANRCRSACAGRRPAADLADGTCWTPSKSAGGRVVLNATEAGERSLGPAFRRNRAHRETARSRTCSACSPVPAWTIAWMSSSGPIRAFTVGSKSGWRAQGARHRALALRGLRPLARGSATHA